MIDKGLFKELNERIGEAFAAHTDAASIKVALEI